MTDNSLKVSQLPTAQNVAPTDRVLILRDPNGSPSVRTVNLSILSANITISNNAPATSSSNGVAGTIAYDNTHFYVCISSNTWVRTNLSTW
jgi:hypothetical protein